MMSDLLSGHMAFIVLPHKPVVRFTFSLNAHSSSACIIDHKPKTFNDAKVNSYVPNIHWWPLTPANIYW